MASYRLQAERRANLTRPNVCAGRACVKPPLELPPWGYGSGRPVSTPLSTINSSRQMTRSRMRSLSPGKQRSICCETGPSQPAAACSRPTGLSNWSNSITAAGLGDVVQHAADKYAPNEIDCNAVLTHLPCTMLGDAAVTGGGPVTTSSMETCTTDGTSTSPNVLSTTGSPHNCNTPELDSIGGTPVMSPQSTGVPLNAMSMVDSANRNTDAINAFISPDTTSQKSVTSTHQLTANEPLTMIAQEAVQTPACSTDMSHEQQTLASLADDYSAAGIHTLVSGNGSHDGKGDPIHRASSKTDPAESPTTTPRANDEEKSSLMVGLVKVKSRHTGLMIDCPILETVCQNEDVDCSTAAVRQSNSHKVVLIKAVVPRWAWNGPEQATSNSSLSGSPSSTKDRPVSRTMVDEKISNKKCAVSVNTQTSDSLLLVYRTTSEQQSLPPSPTNDVDTVKNVPALEDNSQLIPSPKLSACLAGSKSGQKTPNECNLHVPLVASRASSSPNNTSLLSEGVQKKNLIPTETYHPPASGNALMTTEKLNESEFTQRSAASINYDSLMENTTETLKLDLQFSSSGSDSSIRNENNAVKRPTINNHCLSSSSEEMRYDRQLSPNRQGLPTGNWSCAADAVTAADNFKILGYVDEIAERAEPSPKSLHQKSRNARRMRMPSPQGCCPISNSRPHTDDFGQLVTNNYQSSPTSSQRNAMLMPGSCFQPDKSPCMWRSMTSDDAELKSWPGCNLSYQDTTHQQEHQQQFQSHPSREPISSTTQYTSVSESSISDRSKSIFHDCYKTLTPKSSPLHTEQSSTTSPRQLVNCGGGLVCATEPFDVNVHHYHRAADNFRSTTAGDVDATTRKSRHDHHTSTRAKKHPPMGPKSPSEERYKMSTSSAKRAGDRQRNWSVESTRRQNSQSAGSTAVSGNARLPAATSMRQHSSSASRHMARGSRTDKCSAGRDTSSARHASSSPGQYGAIAPYNHRHSKNHSASDPVSARSDRHTSSSGRRHRHGSRVVNASLSRSAESMSRGYRPSVRAKQSNSSHPKHANSRRSRHCDERQSPAMFNECHQPVVYLSPRSLKPFPPPISDRYSPSSFDNSSVPVVGSSLDAESVQYVYAQPHDDIDYGDDQPVAINNYSPRNVPSPRRQDRHYRHAQNNADELDHQRRGNTTSVGGGRRRRKLPVTPVVDREAWCAEPEVSVRIAVPSVVERPAWRQY